MTVWILLALLPYSVLGGSVAGPCLADHGKVKTLALFSFSFSAVKPTATVLRGKSGLIVTHDILLTLWAM